MCTANTPHHHATRIRSHIVIYPPSTPRYPVECDCGSNNHCRQCSIPKGYDDLAIRALATRDIRVSRYIPASCVEAVTPRGETGSNQPAGATLSAIVETIALGQVAGCQLRDDRLELPAEKQSTVVRRRLGLGVLNGRS